MVCVYVYVCVCGVYVVYAGEGAGSVLEVVDSSDYHDYLDYLDYATIVQQRGVGIIGQRRNAVANSIRGQLEGWTGEHKQSNNIITSIIIIDSTIVYHVLVINRAYLTGHLPLLHY